MPCACPPVLITSIHDAVVRPLLAQRVAALRDVVSNVSGIERRAPATMPSAVPVTPDADGIAVMERVNNEERAARCCVVRVRRRLDRDPGRPEGGSGGDERQAARARWDGAGGRANHGRHREVRECEVDRAPSRTSTRPVGCEMPDIAALRLAPTCRPFQLCIRSRTATPSTSSCSERSAWQSLVTRLVAGRSAAAVVARNSRAAGAAGARDALPWIALFATTYASYERDRDRDTRARLTDLATQVGARVDAQIGTIDGILLAVSQSALTTPRGSATTTRFSGGCGRTCRRTSNNLAVWRCGRAKRRVVRDRHSPRRATRWRWRRTASSATRSRRRTADRRAAHREPRDRRAGA